MQMHSPRPVPRCLHYTVRNLTVDIQPYSPWLLRRSIGSVSIPMHTRTRVGDRDRHHAFLGQTSVPHQQRRIFSLRLHWTPNTLPLTCCFALGRQRAWRKASSGASGGSLSTARLKIMIFFLYFYPRAKFSLLHVYFHRRDCVTSYQVRHNGSKCSG
jgi:hypothetical protein